MNYAQAKEYIAKGKNPKGRTIYGKVATELHYIDDTEAIGLKYHQTDVVTFYPDNTIVLNTGGWHTVTTKARINEYLPNGFYLYQDKGIWYVSYGSPYGNDNNKKIYGFAEGMKINLNTGKVEGAQSVKEMKATVKLRKDVNKYCKAFIEELFKGNVKAPSNGDCWDCLLESENGKTLGQLSGSDHIKQHIKEKYYVPSLLARAVEDDNAPVSKIALNQLGYLWGMHDQNADGFNDVARDHLRSALKKYILHELGI